MITLSVKPASPRNQRLQYKSTRHMYVGSRALFAALIVVGIAAIPAEAQQDLQVKVNPDGRVTVSAPGKKMRCTGPADALRAWKGEIGGAYSAINLRLSVQQEWKDLTASSPTRNKFEAMRFTRCLQHLDGNASEAETRREIRLVNLLEQCVIARQEGLALKQCRELEGASLGPDVSITMFDSGATLSVRAGDSLQAHVEVENRGGETARDCQATVGHYVRNSSGRELVVISFEPRFNLSPNERRRLRFTKQVPVWAVGAALARTVVRCADGRRLQAQDRFEIAGKQGSE